MASAPTIGAADGVYVNLFLPSRVTWMQGSTQATLTQKTDYPKANTMQFDLALAKPETFAMYIRIPEWAGAKTTVSVGGKRVDGEVRPGKFLAIQRTWKDGDRVEMEIEQPLRLEAVEQENPNIVALMRGPRALFAMGENPGKATRSQLLAARASGQSADEWIVRGDSSTLVMRPWTSIKDEPYRLYQRV